MRTEVAVGKTRWTPDGTQAPQPPTVFPDPVAGLVTGARAGTDVSGDPYEEFVVAVPKPVEVDEEASRALRAAALNEEDEPPPTGRAVALPPPSSGGVGMPGMLPEPERRNARRRVKQALGGYPKDAANRREMLSGKRQELMAARFGSRRSKTTEATVAAASRKPAAQNRNLGGIILGLVLLAVFGFIALQVIISIVESIGGLVD